MKTADLVSVVIPVYNASKYIENTVKSVLGQTYGAFEIVLVNDGSSDDSETICERLACLNENVRFFSQDNKGVTRARALGVEKSLGKWVFFVDADDFLPENSLELLMERSDKGDIVIGQVSYSLPDLWTIPRFNASLSSAQSVKYLFDGVLHCGPVAKLIKRDLFDEFVFDIPRDVVKGEDFIMNIRLMQRAKRVEVMQDYVYDYIYRPNSVVASVNPFFRLSYCRKHEICVYNSFLPGNKKAYMGCLLKMWFGHRKAVAKNWVKVLLKYVGLLSFVNRFRRKGTLS